jgi:hypothetical protein
MMTQLDSYLGPAEVVAPGGSPGFVDVRLLDGDVVSARIALAQLYSPAVGDEVLVISQRTGDAYVIGVLAGRGTTTIQVPADLTLAAPRGTIRIAAGRGIQVQSGASIEMAARKATLRVGRLNVVAATLVQRLGSAFTWATGLLQWKSRRMRTVTDEGWLVRAERAHLKTAGNTCINGKTVHLG